MLHVRFTNIALLSIERDLTNTVDSDTVLKYFLNNNFKHIIIFIYRTIFIPGVEFYFTLTFSLPF